MPHLHDTPGALKALQDDIYRKKVLRARSQTVEERIAEMLELSNHQFDMMLAEAMHELGTLDEEEGWAEVRRRINRLDCVRDQAFYLEEKPSAA